MKGQALMPDVGAGGDPAISLVGISRGPNILGQTNNLVTSGNGNLGTLPGIYGDIGIFYATIPETAYGSYSGGTIKNNSGDTVGWRTSLGYPLNEWDAWQMAAYGIAGTTNPAYPSSPILDSNGRGNTGWGLANGVAGPESGYAWSFDKDIWDANGVLAPTARADAALVTGPWKRIQYPGSQIANDPPGGVNGTPHAGGADGSTVGYALSPVNPLPSTVSQSDSTSPKAIRWSLGQTTLNVPEYVWVQFRIDSTATILNPDGCPVFKGDTFGGDAGGDSGGKDHLWRYYDSTEITWDACVAISKPSSKAVVKVGDTFQYNVTVFNSGLLDLTNVIVTDTLPSGVTFISALPAQSSGPNPLVWNVGNLKVGQKFESVVTVQAKSSGALENKITVTSSQLPPKQATEITPSGGIVYLSQNKTANPTSIAPGGSTQYTIQINNIGTAATGNPVKIDERLPTGFSYTSLDSVTVNGASLTGSTTVNSSDPNKPIFSIPASINAGSSLTLRFTVGAAAGLAAGSYCNSFTTTQNNTPLATGALACVSVGGGRIGDTVFRDWNGNGVQDAGEEGIPGVTVSLSGASSATAVTDANGNYLFTGLVAGSYTVAVTGGIPGSYTATGPATSPANLTLATDEQRLDVDFGYQPGGAGSIGDLVFKDIANDGVFNGADSGIPNVTVWLYEDSNGNGAIDINDLKVMTTTTNGSGLYTFSGLAEGLSYLVDVDESDPDLAAAFNPNAFTNSTPALQPVSNLTGSYTAADFGFFENLPSSIGDQVFVDANNNGVYDNGETLLPGVTVRLYRDANSDGIADPGELAATTSTNITGTYTFGALGPGEYLVVVDAGDPEIPGGYAPSIGQFA